MRISIGNDHAGPDYKHAIVNYLKSKGIEINNHGTESSQSVDYPDFAHLVAHDMVEGISDYGILICGSGNGVSMTVNKYKEIRAALCWNKEITTLSRLHNNANVLCIPARFTAIQQAVEMVEVFLNTPFEGGRHARRVDKISCF